MVSTHRHARWTRLPVRAHGGLPAAGGGWDLEGVLGVSVCSVLVVISNQGYAIPHRKIRKAPFVRTSSKLNESVSHATF